jgi:hypothetical protein
MIEATLDLKKPLEYIKLNSTNREFQEISLEDNEWDYLIYLKVLFEVFLKPSIRLQGQLYTTLSDSLLFIYIIYKNLNKLQQVYLRKIQQNEEVFIFYFIIIILFTNYIYSLIFLPV